MISKEQTIANLLEKESHLPDLFARFLTPIAPDSTVFCLGTGLGGELPYVRALAPSGRVVAFDNTDDPRIQAMSADFVAALSAEFYPIDLSIMSIEKLVGQFGSPHLIICRHPDVLEHPFWINHLYEWSNLMREIGGQLLVTNYDKLEQLQIIQRLLFANIVPDKIDVFTGGHTYKPSFSLISFRSDKYVFVVG